MRTDILERENEIRQWVSENRSKASMAKELGCNPKTINAVLERLGIEYKGNQSGKGISKPNGRYIPLLEYLEVSVDIQSNKIRRKLIQEGYKECKCERCGLSEWLGEPLHLELHHIDGDKTNNTLENF